MFSYKACACCSKLLFVVLLVVAVVLYTMNVNVTGGALFDKALQCK